MVWWWIAMGSSVAACLALVPVYGRRRAERARLDMIRARVEASLSELLKQPDGSPTSCGDRGVAPPTFASAAASPAGSAVRCRRRVVLGDPSLSTTLGPGWRFQ